MAFGLTAYQPPYRVAVRFEGWDQGRADQAAGAADEDVQVSFTALARRPKAGCGAEE